MHLSETLITFVNYPAMGGTFWYSFLEAKMEADVPVMA